MSSLPPAYQPGQPVVHQIVSTPIAPPPDAGNAPGMATYQIIGPDQGQSIRPGPSPVATSGPTPAPPPHHYTAMDNHFKATNERLLVLKQHLSNPNGYCTSVRTLIDWCSNPRSFDRHFEINLIGCLQVVSRFASTPGFDLELGHRLLEICVHNRHLLTEKSAVIVTQWFEDLNKVLSMRYQKSTQFVSPAYSQQMVHHRPAVFEQPSQLQPNAPMQQAFSVVTNVYASSHTYPPQVGPTPISSMANRPYVSTPTQIMTPVMSESYNHKANHLQHVPDTQRQSNPAQVAAAAAIAAAAATATATATATANQMADKNQGVMQPSGPSMFSPSQVQEYNQNIAYGPGPPNQVLPHAVQLQNQQMIQVATPTSGTTVQPVNSLRPPTPMSVPSKPVNTATPTQPTVNNAATPTQPAVNAANPTQPILNVITPTQPTLNGVHPNQQPHSSTLSSSQPPPATPPNLALSTPIQPSNQVTTVYSVPSTVQQPVVTHPQASPSQIDGAVPKQMVITPQPQAIQRSQHIIQPNHYSQFSSRPNSLPLGVTIIDHGSTPSGYHGNQTHTPILSASPIDSPVVHSPYQPQVNTQYLASHHPTPTGYHGHPQGLPHHTNIVYRQIAPSHQMTHDSFSVSPGPEIHSYPSPHQFHTMSPMSNGNVQMNPVGSAPLQMNGYYPSPAKDPYHLMRLTFPLRDGGMLLKPFKLPHGVTHSNHHFILSDKIYPMLMERFDLELQLNCYHEKDKQEVCNWPAAVSVMVNNEKFPIDKGGGSWSLHKPLHIKRACQPGPNYLRITAPQCCCSHNFVLCLVHRPSVKSMLQKLLAKKQMKEEICKSRMKKHFTGSDDSVQQTAIRISLKCPITYKRISIPSRGSDCHHMQSFDLESYLELNCTRSAWKCPVCGGLTPYDSLEVDTYMWSILAKLKDNDEFEEVTINSDCSWSPVRRPISSKGEESEDTPKPKKSRVASPSSLQGPSTPTVVTPNSATPTTAPVLHHVGQSHPTTQGMNQLSADPPMQATSTSLSNSQTVSTLAQNNQHHISAADVLPPPHHSQEDIISSDDFTDFLNSLPDADDLFDFTGTDRTIGDSLFS